MRQTHGQREGHQAHHHHMERWRWMPEDLGQVYVWNNSPEFMLYVVKDGKRIYADKTLVGTSAYATPVFSADLKTVVFNPDWVAPPTVVTENLLSPLSEGSYSILRIHGLSVSLNGKPVDPTRVSWNRSNILGYTFSKEADLRTCSARRSSCFPTGTLSTCTTTLPVRKKYSRKRSMIGHECVRMEKPDKFASVLLAEDKGWGADKVKACGTAAATAPSRSSTRSGAHGVFHRRGGRDRQGRNVWRCLWP